jgi:hypothetical protein
LRFSTVAAAVCLGLLAVVGGIAAVPPGQSTDVSPGAVAPAAANSAPAAPAPLSGDAAAKHAKRTACLKSAKAKKLVGAEKTSFLKTCIAAP